MGRTQANASGWDEEPESHPPTGETADRDEVLEPEVNGTLRALFGPSIGESADALFKAISQSTSAGIFVGDSRGNSLYENPRLLEMTGYTPDELHGTGYHKVIHPEDLERVGSLIQNAGPADAFDAEYRFLPKNGPMFWARVSTAPLLAEDGTLLGRVGVVIDVSDHHRVEQDLRRNGALLEQAQQLLEVGSWCWDLETDEVEWSPELFKILGWDPGGEPGSVRYDTFLDQLFPDERAKIEAAVAGIIASGGTLGWKGRIKFPSGEARIVDARCLALRDESGKVTSLLGAVRDVTQVEDDHKRLLDRKRLLEAVARGGSLSDVLSAVCLSIEGELEGSLCAVYLVTPDKKLVRFAAGPSISEELVGALGDVEVASESKTCGMAVFSGRPQVTPDLLADPQWAVSREQIELYGLRCCWSTPIRDPRTNEILGTFVVMNSTPTIPRADQQTLVEDYTSICSVAIEKHRMDEKRASLEAQLRHSQRLEAMGQMAAGVSHDLNNLMTAVYGNIAVLQGETLSPEGEKAVDQIELVTEMTASLVGQLVEFSRGRPVDTEIVEVNETLASLESMLLPMAREDLSLEIELCTGELWVQVGKGQLEQILVNLFINACDSMPGGGRVRISTRHHANRRGAFRKSQSEADGYALISVSDSGLGMEPRILDRIFEPFFSTKDKLPGKGTGLGLATVHGIVTGAGGWVTAESDPGKGTVFTVGLPSSDSFPGRKDTSSGPSSSSEPLGGVVLLVEDDDLVRSSLRRALDSVGELLVASDGLEALELVADHPRPIDLLVTDVAMPRMNGRDLATALSKVNPDLKVLFVTGYAEGVLSQTDLDDTIQILQKPFRASDLLQCVRSMLQDEG